MTDEERTSPRHYMETLHCTYEEALQLIKDDQETQKGIAHDWDLTKEEMKKGMKNLRPERKTTVTKTRPRKENPEKRKIISLLMKALQTEMKNVSVGNPEKTIDFCGEDGVKYSVTLTAHRK